MKYEINVFCGVDLFREGAAMQYITSAQMRKIEERAINGLSIPSILLMENAAAACVKHIDKYKNAVVVCGTGNNGGDGFAAARLLHVKGVRVNAILIGGVGKVKGDALTNMKIAQKMNLISDKPLADLLKGADVVVDAIFGTGFTGLLTGDALHAAEAINNCGAEVISVDIPSGVEADTGKIGNTAVKADKTITFALPKIGHLLYPGTEHTGQLFVEDISIPRDFLNPDGGCLEVLERMEILLPPRPRRSNKGTFGRVCVVAGCNDMPGAAVLCCKAAYKAGAGLVQACVVPEVAQVIQHAAHEVITSDISSVKKAAEAADVIAIGPGLGRGAEITKFVLNILGSCDKPMVIDADGLVALANDKHIFKSLKAPCVITPHPGEMAVLTGSTINEVLENLTETAQKFAKDYNVITLLKDARTVIASPCGRTFVNTTGTSALAKAGSGDVLTGIIAAFAAQGTDAFMAAVLGAFVHGKAGQAASETLSIYGVCAEDAANYVPQVLN